MRSKLLWAKLLLEYGLYVFFHEINRFVPGVVGTIFMDDDHRLLCGGGGRDHSVAFDRSALGIAGYGLWSLFLHSIGGAFREDGIEIRPEAYDPGRVPGGVDNLCWFLVPRAG